MSDLYRIVKRQDARISELEDLLAKTIRKYDDLLFNLDDENFSKKILKEREKMKASLSVTAEKIETAVEKISEDGKSISSLIQTADSISASVEKYSGEILALSTKITQTAESIRLEANKYTDEKFAEFEINADGISASVKRAFQNPEIVSDFDSVSIPDKNTVYYSKADKKKHYYNSITNAWESTDSDGISSLFTQTPDGFKLDGSVKISGDVITSGTVSADRIDADSLRIRKLYENRNDLKDGAFAKINSEYGDFGIYLPPKDGTGEADNPTENDCVFGIYISDPLTQPINFYSHGKNFFGYSNAQEKSYPKGTWDFSSCDVTGLSAVARFG